MHSYSWHAWEHSCPWHEGQCRSLFSHPRTENRRLAETSKCRCSSSFWGGGQQHGPLQPFSPQELQESQPTGCVSSYIVQLGETQALFVYNNSCTRALMLLLESPVRPSPPLQLHPWLQWKDHKEGGDHWHENHPAVQQPPSELTAHLEEVRGYGHLATGVLIRRAVPLHTTGESLPPQLFSILTWLYTGFLVI